MHSGLRELSLQLELLQQTDFCTEFDDPNSLPKSLGRAFTATSLLLTLRTYASACGAVEITRLSKTLGGPTAKPLSRLSRYLRAHEARRGSDMNNTTRLRGHVEVDAHKVRTAWLSKKTSKYLTQVAALHLKHPAPRKKTESFAFNATGTL